MKKIPNNSLYINYDRLSRIKNELGIKIAIIARPDWFLKENNCQHLVVETNQGIHQRCFLANYQSIQFLIIYGRFERKRTTSQNIDFALNQEVLSVLGIEKIIGTFSVGSIKKESRAGPIYVVTDFVGMGGYDQTRSTNASFKNVDMINPFCGDVVACLQTNAHGQPYDVRTKGTYVCFHGYPRIETAAELSIYAKNGWDMVGQTLDPEATLAREAGCHYAALAATIDDIKVRSKFAHNDQGARAEIDAHTLEGRKKTFELFLQTLPALSKLKTNHCNCLKQANDGKQSKNFYYLPAGFFE